MTRHALCLVLLALSVLVSSLWTRPALAQDPDELAKRHFEAGVSYLQQSDHERALQEFQRSFELSNRPEVLLNVATVHERMGNLQLAVEALEQYLALAPDGEHAGTVQIRIENLKKRIPTKVEEPAEPEQPAAPAPAPPAQTQAAEPAPATAAPSANQEKQPDRTLAYVVLGGAGAFAIGATVTGIMAKAEHDNLENDCAPYCNKNQTSRGRSLALVSTILTGVAVVGAAGGVLLWMSADGGDEGQVATSLPRVDLDVGRDQVRASAAWSF